MSKDPKANYYDAGNIETLEIIRAKLTPEQFKGYLLGNIIKYNCRVNFKHPTAEGRMRDIEKIIVYSAELKQIFLDESVEETASLNAEYNPGGSPPEPHPIDLVG